MVSDDPTSERYGWPVRDWAAASGVSRATVYNLINENRIEAVKVYGRRLITTHPKDFLASLKGAA